MLESVAIECLEVDKSYKLGKKTTSFRENLSSFFIKSKNRNESFNALKNVSFSINKGEVLGIIGKNGAGKSTLLKVLSKITKPTKGKIEINGRVASLLEVGTGFHPELTGRENIFLNGTILGMTRKEVASKLNEIITFSGVEKFIDTPVKHYSSGMYVRLAFSVAAHLEPEILIIDEVLAVGDYEFQKKCLGKMEDVANNGRTVIFVSHNMTAVQSLCDNCLLLENGKVIAKGATNDIIDQYLVQGNESFTNIAELKDRKGSQKVRFISLDYYQESRKTNKVKALSPLKLIIRLNKKASLRDLKIDVGFNNQLGVRVAWVSTDLISKDEIELNPEGNEIRISITNFNLIPGSYNVNLFMNFKNDLADWVSNVAPFEVVEFDYHNCGKSTPNNQGFVVLKNDIKFYDTESYKSV